MKLKKVEGEQTEDWTVMNELLDVVLETGKVSFLMEVVGLVTLHFFLLLCRLFL